jgi:ATP synthase protein I
LTAPPSVRELPAVYYRRAALPTGLVTIGGTALAALIGGRPEAVGFLVGGLIVLAFFGVDVLALVISREWDPAVTFLLVMIEYFTKIVVLGLILVALSDQEAVDGRSVALAVGLATVVFLTFLVIAHVRVPTFVVEPPAPPEDAS